MKRWCALWILFWLGAAHAAEVSVAVAAPSLKSLYTAGSMGTKTLPQALHLPHGVVVFAVVLMAVGGFAGASWVERRFGGAGSGAGS